MAKQEIAVPTGLERRVKAYLKANSGSSWDDAVEAIVEEDGA